MNIYDEDNSDVDEFFGKQSDDDDIDNNYHHGPKEPIHSNQNSTTKTIDAMSAHETKSKQSQFHSIGFLEGYEHSKELHLQRGFEAGYTDTINGASRIGALLGRIVFLNASTACDDDDDDGSGAANGPGDVIEATRLVRMYLQEEQGKDGSWYQDRDGVDGGDDGGMNHIEERLKGILNIGGDSEDWRNEPVLENDS